MKRHHDEFGGLSRRLREARPEPPDALVDRLAASMTAATPRRRRRLAPALAVTGALIVALGAVGGLSYGATLATDVVHSITRHATYIGSRMPLAAQVAKIHNAAFDQYNGGGGGSGGSGGSGGESGGSGPSGPSGPSGGGGGSSSDQTTQTTTATPASGGSVTVTPASGSDTGTVAVTWDAGTFTTASVVTVDTTPVTAAPIVGSSQALVSIVVTDPSTGQPVHELATPLTVEFQPPPGGFPSGYIPLISTDGVTWRATAELPSPTLPAGQADGFYRWTAADGDAHPVGTLLILTRHLTFFAVLFSSNASASESGRKTPQAGSGLFGDPTRNHTGPPVMKRIGIGTMPSVVARGAALYVPVTFFLDEQAVLHFSVFGPGNVPVLIVPQGTNIGRVGPAHGAPTHNLKVVVLRPGTIKATIRLVPREILPGRHYRLRLWAVDYDQHATVRYITFRG